MLVVPCATPCVAWHLAPPHRLGPLDVIPVSLAAGEEGEWEREPVLVKGTLQCLVPVQSLFRQRAQVAHVSVNCWYMLSSVLAKAIQASCRCRVVCALDLSAHHQYHQYFSLTQYHHCRR